MNNTKGTILVTDSLFIFPEHEEKIKSAGYEIERLDTPNASEDELIKALEGKVGYILGGIEKVTDKIINSADKLKIISFTGSDWKSFIPGYELAQKKGIKITNTPGANSYAVAEYTILAILAMIRNFSELTRVGDKKFQTTKSLNELTVGIIGMGMIGSQVSRMLKGLGVKRILYFSKHRKIELENEYNIEFCELNSLLQNSDVVSLHFSKDAGNNFIGKNELSLMKNDSILINCGCTGAIDKNSLFIELENGRIRAFQDDPMDERYNSLPKYIWQNSNSHTAFNTYEANKKASDMATQSVLNILGGDSDNYIVL